jgi:serine/threonine-protein kinase PRP4
MRSLTHPCRISPRHTPTPTSSGKPETSQSPLPTAVSKQGHEPELDLSTTPPPVEDTLAARRARRQVIMAKYAGLSSINTSQNASPSPGPSSAALPPPALSTYSDQISQPQSAHATPELAELHIAPSGFLNLGLAVVSDEGQQVKRDSLSASPTPGNFELLKDGEQEDVQLKVVADSNGNEQISAADYDPSLDRREDEKKRVYGGQDGRDDDIEMIEEEDVEEEDVDDMFAALTSEKKVKRITKVVVRNTLARDYASINS